MPALLLTAHTRLYSRVYMMRSPPTTKNLSGTRKQQSDEETEDEDRAYGASARNLSPDLIATPEKTNLQVGRGSRPGSQKGSADNSPCLDRSDRGAVRSTGSSPGLILQNDHQLVDELLSAEFANTRVTRSKSKQLTLPTQGDHRRHTTKSIGKDRSVLEKVGSGDNNMQVLFTFSFFFP